jgi:hypothetical protein
MRLDLFDTVAQTSSNISINWIGIFDPYFNISFIEGRVWKTNTRNYLIHIKSIILEISGQLNFGVHQLEFFDRAYGIDRFNDFEEPEGNPDIYYTTIQGNVGVLRIYTFSPKDRAEFIKTAEEALCTFAANNISKLIIDLSQNGGGSICLGYGLERFLFPLLSPVVGAYDIKASDLFRMYSDAGAELLCTEGGTINDTLQFCGTNPELVGYFTPCAWFDWYSGEEYYDETWFIPGNYASRGGVSAYYTSFVSQGCDDAFTMWIPGQATGLSLRPENVILVSDGLCGSTCAVFSR